MGGRATRGILEPTVHTIQGDRLHTFIPGIWCGSRVAPGTRIRLSED
jgi:hypothetical protein